MEKVIQNISSREKWTLAEWSKAVSREELKDEMKNRISMALKDPILQQSFEIICKENAALKDDLCRVTSDRDGYRTTMLSYEHKIKDLENKLTEQKRQIEIMKETADAELVAENIVLKKALHLYVDWADECGIAWDNFPDMKEKWYKTVEEKDLGWIDGLVFMIIEEAKEQVAKAALNNGVDK